MKTRKPHNKTRLGCAQCKQRRVKCDVRHPRCSNCEKRGVDCSFKLLAPSQPLSTASTQSTAPSTEVAVVHKPRNQLPYEVHIFRHDRDEEETSKSHRQPSPRSPSLETRFLKTPCDFLSEAPWKHVHLEWPWKEVFHWDTFPTLKSLLSHYQNATSLTLANDRSSKLALQSSVPEMATNHSYLIHGILSVTALHLSHVYSDPRQKSSLNRLSVDQMNRALASYRPAIAKMTEDNAASLFATAAMTTVFVFRTATTDMGDALAALPKAKAPVPQDTINHLVQSITRTVWSLRGAMGALAPGWRWVTDSKLRALVSREWWPERIPMGERALEEDRKLCQLESLWMQPELDHESHNCLTDSLQELRNTYALVSQLTCPDTHYPVVAAVPYCADDTTVGLLKDRAAIIAWASVISRGFINLLEQSNRQALIIIAHWAILLGRVRSVWWLEGLGANIVMAVATIVGREDWHLLKWPVETVGVDLENSFG